MKARKGEVKKGVKARKGGSCREGSEGGGEGVRERRGNKGRESKHKNRHSTHAY